MVSDLRHDLIGEGIDLAIRMGRLGDSSLKSIKLGQVEPKLVAAPKYLAGRPPARAPAALAAWDWLGLSQVPTALRLIQPSRQAAAKLAFTPRLVADDAGALYRLARAGLGSRRVLCRASSSLSPGARGLGPGDRPRLSRQPRSRQRPHDGGSAGMARRGDWGLCGLAAPCPARGSDPPLRHLSPGSDAGAMID